MMRADPQHIQILMTNVHYIRYRRFRLIVRSA
jgi:hypothetical protein